MRAQVSLAEVTVRLTLRGGLHSVAWVLLYAVCVYAPMRYVYRHAHAAARRLYCSISVQYVRYMRCLSSLMCCVELLQSYGNVYVYI